MNPWTLIGWFVLGAVALLIVTFGIVLISAAIISVKESAKKRLK